MHCKMSTTNKNGISGPIHLNKHFFEKALRNGFGEQSINVKRVIFTSGSGDGESYCSQVYRVTILYVKNGELEPDIISVIVKCLPSNEGLMIPENLNVNNKEICLVTEILPQFEILLDDIQFAPRCFFDTDSPVKTLVLEDMKIFGYQMANREAGLDERHAKLTLKKLGQFHAVSMVYAKKKPLTMTQFNTGLLDPKAIKPSANLYKILHKYLGYEIKLASEWEDFEEITEKLQAFHNDFQARLIACQEPREDEIKVLNHGDFWVNNLLFKYDPRNNPVDLVFLDFQLSIYGSPGIDLNYFLHASVQLDVLKKWETLLEVYHASLRDTLLELSYGDIPSFAAIVNEFKQKSAYGLFTLFGPLPIMTMSRNLSEGNSFESLAESDEKMESIFGSEKLVEHLKYSLLELDRMGALDK